MGLFESRRQAVGKGLVRHSACSLPLNAPSLLAGGRSFNVPDTVIAKLARPQPLKE
jgi:hypothetical protein